MKCKNTYSPLNSLTSKQLNLSDFNFEKPVKKYIKKSKKNNKNKNKNNLIKFIIATNNYAKRSLNKYSNCL